MRIFDVAIKTLKETVRQPKSLALSLGLPVAFMLIFGLAFGDSSTNETTTLHVLNEDEGELGAAYVEGLANLTFDDGTPVFAITEIAAGGVPATREAIEATDVDALVTIPANFSANLARAPPGGGAGALPPIGGSQPQPRPASETAVVRVLGDPSRVPFTIASQVVAGYTREFGEAVTQTPAPAEVTVESVTASKLTSFDFIAPGLMVFAILNLAPQAAAVLARETELRTIDRVRLAPIRSAELLAGVALAEIALAMVSLALMLGTAKLMGFDNQGSYVALYLIAIGAAFGVVGLGMLIASFAKTQQEAANIGTMVSVPASFLSGSFFPIPTVALFTWGERTIDLYDVLPTAHAVDAMRAVATFGSGIETVLWSLGAIGALALVYFGAGVALYRARRLAPE